MTEQSPIRPPGAPSSLAELEARIAYDLACADYPRSSWLPARTDRRGRHVHDVVIIGAGQSGLAAAWALKRLRVDDVRIFDRAPKGFEGPWDTYARMETLRTPKHVTALESGMPSLSFRAWYDASGFQPGWEGLQRAPRRIWMEYLRWFRRVLGLAVENEAELLGFSPTDDGFIAIDLRRGAAIETVVARKLVMATGLDGCGRYEPPPALVKGLPAHLHAHAYHDIDFARLAGKRVAILGIGSAATDNAAAALEAGCASADLFARRSHPVNLDARDWVEHAGFLGSFADLSDALRWRVSHRLVGVSSPAPPWSLERCEAFPNCRFHFGAAWRRLEWTGKDIVIDTARGAFTVDFVIFATGTDVDLSGRPEFTAHAPFIALWRDRFQPEPAEAVEDALAYPYLGQGYELTERREGTAPYLSDVHVFNHAAVVSMGVGAATVTGLAFAASRLSTAIARDLYRAVAAEHVAAMPWPPYHRPTPPHFPPLEGNNDADDLGPREFDERAEGALVR